MGAYTLSLDVAAFLLFTLLEVSVDEMADSPDEVQSLLKKISNIFERVRKPKLPKKKLLRKRRSKRTGR